MKISEILTKAQQSAVSYYGADCRRDSNSHINGYVLGFTAALEWVIDAAEQHLIANRKIAGKEHWYCIFVDNLQKLTKLED